MNIPYSFRFTACQGRHTSPSKSTWTLVLALLCLSSTAGAQTPGGVVDSMAFWLHAADINDDGGATNPASGDSVSIWSDISATATTHDFNDATDVGSLGDLVPPLFAGGEDSRAINYRPAVTFHANDAGLQTPNDNSINVGNQTLKSLAVVFRSSSTAGAGTEVVYEEGGGTNGINVFTHDGSVGMGVWARSSSTGWETYASVPGSNNTVYLASIVYDGERDSTVSLYLNGVLLASDTAEILPGHTGQVAIGQVRGSSRSADWSDGSSNGSFFNGQLAEMVYFNQAWNSAERLRTESALAIRYGVSLGSDYVDASGGTLWSLAANAGFTSGVAAIGRDDAGNTDQRQSRSGAGGILSIGLDSIADAHGDHPTAFSSDGDFLFWSHNGADALPSTSGVPAGSSLILERVWQAREPSGEVGNVDLKFHLSDFGLPGSSLSDFTLLVKNASSDFTVGATAYAADGFVDGDYVIFRDIDLDDGDRFTLASNSGLSGPAGLTAGLSIWYAADQMVTESSGVSLWENLAPPSYDLIQPSSGVRPTYHTAGNLLNFNPKVEFDGTTEYLAITDLHYDPANRIDKNTACVVFRTDHSGSNNWALLDFDRSEYFNFNVNDAGTLELALATGSVSDLDGSAISGLNNGIPHIGCFRYDNSVVTDVAIRADGGVAYSADVKATSSQLGSGSSLTRYGFVGDGSEATGENGGRNNVYFEGDIAELVYFEDTALSDAEFERLESYLAAKYGITLQHDYLASDGSTYWDITALSAYSRGILVLGRDDDAGLSQKQSRSQTSGSALSVGLGSIAASNAANANGFGGNMRFTAIGHDNGSTDATDAGVPAGYNIILNRTWYVEEYGGDPGNLHLQFDMGTIVLPGTAVGDFVLVVENGDADFSMGATTYPATGFDGVTLDFTGINLADGDYFSIASSGQYVGPAPAGLIDNLELWFAGDSALTTSGSAVVSWGNSAPKAPSLSQTGSSERPTLLSADPGMNFNANIRFDGVNDYLPISQLNLQTPVNQIMTCAVFRTAYEGTAYNDNWSFIDYDRSEWFNVFIRGDDGSLGFSYTASNTRDNYSSATGFNDSLPHLVCARYDNTLTNETYMRVDGNVEVNTNRESTGQTVGTVLNRYGFVGVGSEAETYDGSNNGSTYTGDIPEVLLYLDDTLTDADMDKIETYLGLKYGIHLEHDYVASNDVVIWDASSLSAYHHDVAGIGKDLTSGLDQRKARSTNGDDLLTLWLGAETDEASPLAFGEDLSFMLWGNDDGSLDTVQTTDVPSGIVERIPRVWRFAEQEVMAFSGSSVTREVGQVSIQFDLTKLSGAAAVHPWVSEDSLQNLRLLLSSVSSFAGATAYAPDAVSAADRTVTFTLPGGDIGDGSFITLGATSTSPLPVEWTAFEASPVGEQVLLEWSTGAEINASHFVPQRSTDGQSWTPLGQLPAAGSSWGADYRFVDEHPMRGWNFYRIHQLDLDGSADYSEVRGVSMGQPQEAQLYPVPASDRLYARFASARSGEGLWKLVDHMGRVQQQGQAILAEGSNLWQWETRSLSTGWYGLVVLDQRGQVLVQRSFLVQHGSQ